MDRRQRQQHVVAVPLPAQGHLNPLMRFCKLLAAQGFLVTFVNIDPIHHRIDEVRNGGVADADADMDGAHDCIRCDHIPIDSLNLANDFRVSFEAFFEAQNSIAPHLEALLSRLNRLGPPVTCLMSDIGMTLPTQNVADKFNIPRIVFYPNSASLQLFVSYVIQGRRTSAKQVLEGLKRSKTEAFCDGSTLPGLPALLNTDLPDFAHVVDDNVFMWRFISQTWQQSESFAHAMVINSFEELEAPTFKALSEGFRLPVYGIGPLVEPLGKETSLWKEDEGCIAWLDKQPSLSVLYISFGSITILSQSQFDEIMAALIASAQRFLWVFRPDLVKGVTSNSGSSAFDVIMDQCNGRGCVVEWAPQLRVLAHPSVGGFLTHCGWNSVLEAIAHGMPMLCWPYFSDQTLDAKYVVEEWKIGLQLNEASNGLVERGEIEKVMKALMEGNEGRTLRENVSRLKEMSYKHQSNSFMKFG
ncbi:hypothetical protein GOP47_0001818 [Adiantum capillus-veneris]|uniref:Glycosyltransferase n=1 Tax=Adiantum capillus-veneris TaxID=13818 RepID=A0A9D4ZR20_ADICA|nr:hypothetical protein GOP47_0001818 [Adiantum capillus-veneris]